MEEFEKNDLEDWILPVIDGYIDSESFDGEASDNGTYIFILISRRDCMRTGSRFLTRGADIEGNVANFVETEQIITMNNDISSWVQTRGSIPIVWYQVGSNNIRPKPMVDDVPVTVCI